MDTGKKGVFIALVAAACFGITSPITKWFYQYNISPVTMLPWRFLIAAILVWGYIFLMRKDLNIRVSGEQLAVLAIGGGVCNFLAVQLCSSALQYVPISIQVMTFYTYPFMVNILGVFLFREKMGILQIMALILAFWGILMTVTVQTKDLNYLGVLLGFGAAIANTGYILILGSRKIAEVDSIVIGAYSMLFSTISFTVNAVRREEFRFDMELSCWGGIVLVAVFSTVVAMILLSKSIQLIGSAKAAIISVFEPIEAILLGVLLFQERLSLRGRVGICLVVTAIILINMTQLKIKNEKS